MWGYVIGGLIGLLIGGAVLAINWDKIANYFRSLLVKHNLESSMLEKAFVAIDRVMVRGRRAFKVFFNIQKKGHRKVSTIENETIYEGTENFKTFDEELGSSSHLERDLTNAV